MKRTFKLTKQGLVPIPTVQPAVVEPSIARPTPKPKAGNWELCRMSRYLQNVLEVPVSSAGMDVKNRGQEKEDLVSKSHPNWRTVQETLRLPNGRKCRLDFLDENGCPVEVKGMSQASLDKFNCIEDLLNAPYKYQVEYAVQLSAYCMLKQKPGRFLLISHESIEDYKKDGTPVPEKFIEMTLEYAMDIWKKFNKWEIKVPSCAFCKTEQGCAVLCKMRRFKRDANAFNRLNNVVDFVVFVEMLLADQAQAAIWASV